MGTLILTRTEVESLLSMERVVDAVEGAFAAYGRGEAVMPAKVYLDLPEVGGDFRAMPAFMAGSAGVKWVNSHPGNPERHQLPSVMGVYILNDPATALPLAVMDATIITAYRTGAAGAVASKYLAVGEPRSLGFIGCGVQARVLLSAHKVLWNDLELVMADVNEDAAARFARASGGRAGTLEEAAACDIVCTSTPSRAAVVQRSWVRAGSHINAMGADAPGKQELDPQLLVDGRVIIDDAHQAHHSGEVNVALADGTLTADQIDGELGEVVAGTRPGRTGDEITIFDSTGLAVQDVAVARMIYDLARERGVGSDIPLVGR
jgi:ornithine cyclodeaminase/alanine dehydrogenase